MYEGFFQLQRRPFAATPDPGCCYLSPTQSPLIQSVARCIEHGQGIAILTGPAGIGKTLLTQVLLADAAPRFTGAYLGTGQFPTRRALLQAILYELGQPYGGMTDQELRLELNTTLRQLITRQDGLLLVLDEAHLLSDRLLEEIRLVADLAQHGVPLARVVLSGNPEFEERLTAPALAAFNQRVACHVVLETHTRIESIGYLEHRIQWAGGLADELFDRDAMHLIADASDGLPRCLNQLADHSLMQAYLAGQSRVSASLVRQTLGELQRLPLRWNPSALHDRSATRAPAIETPADEFAESISTPTESTTTLELVPDSETCCFEFGADTSEETISVHDAAEETSVTHSIIEMSDAQPESPDFDAAETVEDDGPPLFAWLAKPAIDLPVHTDDEFSTSCFNIAARTRQRAPAVELEVVSMAPLSGSELISKKRRAEVSDAASAMSTRKMGSGNPRLLPAEELIVDHYASLDSQHAPIFPQPAVCFPTVTLAVNESAAGHAIEDVSSSQNTATEPESVSNQQPAVESPATPPSSFLLDRLDAICALLDEETESSPNCGGVELITDHGIERIDVDLPGTLANPADLNLPSLPAGDLEDWIGSTVVEVGRNVQQARAMSSPDAAQQPRTSKVAELLDAIERELHFDVVEPDSHSQAAAARSNPIPEMRQPPEGYSGVVPPPNHSYKNFFSMLRRRQTR